MKINRTFCGAFQYHPVRSGNQQGGREYDDLQNWLDITSHENPLLQLSGNFMLIQTEMSLRLYTCLEFIEQYVWHILYAQINHSLSSINLLSYLEP